MAAYLGALRGSLSAAAPRLQALFEKPGANELLADLQWGLLQRFAARSIKFALGVQQAVQQGQQVGTSGEQGTQAQSPLVQAAAQVQAQALRDGLGTRAAA